jgi:hypothetical protein
VDRVVGRTRRPALGTAASAPVHYITVASPAPRSAKYLEASDAPNQFTGHGNETTSFPTKNALPPFLLCNVNWLAELQNTPKRQQAFLGFFKTMRMRASFTRKDQCEIE